MDVKGKIDQVLSEDLTRKEFLARAGTVAISLVGITAMLRSLGMKGSNSGSSYGSSSYGGKTLDR